MSGNENHLIGLLARAERKRLIERCESVELQRMEMLCERHAPTRYVYFPITGFVSLGTEIDGRPDLEVGMVGCEGMLGAELLLGHTTPPWRAVVQGAGAAWRLKAATFQRALADSLPLRQLVGRYLACRIEQLTLAAGCDRFHEIGPRLARWLLMTQDRAQSDRFHMTHECLAFMLGVRRVGVTVAASLLQRQGLIAYRRGELTVLDRAGLQARACSCYASNLRAYEQTVH
jgi:CRP-like cAMP-binding protein